MEELQQQVSALKAKEATLTKTNAEVNQLFQELNTRLADVETEHRKSKEEVRDSRSSGFKLFWKLKRKDGFPFGAKPISLES